MKGLSGFVYRTRSGPWLATLPSLLLGINYSIFLNSSYSVLVMASPPTQLPGFGRPVNFYQDSQDAFPNAVDPTHLDENRTRLELTTLREFTMLHIMNSITDKPDWRTKVFSDEIANKWKREALEMPGKDISPQMMDWVIDELRYKAKLYEDLGAVCVYTGHVVKSDTVVPDSLRLELQAAVTKLEDVPDKQKDWHPGSNGKVLDLVHPSLYPVVYGRTRVLETGRTSLDDCIARCGEGQTTKIPTKNEVYVGDSTASDAENNENEIYTRPYSQHFQWLPCTVDISGEHSRITSYINNLHPAKYKGLYRLIEGIIDAAIPLWNLTLAPLQSCDWSKYKRIEYHGDDKDEEMADDGDDDGGDNDDGDNDDGDNDDGDDGDDEPADDGDDEENDGEDSDSSDPEKKTPEYRAAVEKMMTQPEPGTFAPPTEPEETLDLKEKYHESGLQIIVKLANIQLTPENPSYEGGSWHVEGQLNEHICATALYYYSNENIEASNLAFRQQSDTEATDDIMYPQDFHDWFKTIFGCESEEAGLQDVGSVETRQGRLISFPNIFQHQVQPFSLVDRTKPGHRKIVALFLVDPHLSILSTANVPCQRKDWWRDYTAQLGTGLDRLPVELQDEVYNVPDGFPITLDEAKDFRLKLMDERKVFVVEHDGAFKVLEFSLCEH